MPLRHKVARKAFAMTSVTVILTALFVGALPLSPYVETADAKYLTDGNGYFEDYIDWIEWTPNARTSWNGGNSGTRELLGRSERLIGEGTLITTCTARVQRNNGNGSAVHQIESYRPGSSWGGDAISHVYYQTSPGSGLRNNSYYALKNVADAQAPLFDFSCTTAYTPIGGTPVAVPMQGLVFADGESLTNIGSEYIEATPTSAGTYNWRLLERIRSTSCNTNAYLTLTSSSNKLKMHMKDEECGNQSGTNYGPAAVTFMEATNGSANALAAQVKMQGRGMSAVALGVILSVDFGDAPTEKTPESKIPFSYGTAGALFKPTWSGAGLISGGESAVFDTNKYPVQDNFHSGLTQSGSSQNNHVATAQLNTSRITPRLGPAISSEGGYTSNVQAGSDIVGDDAFVGGAPIIPIIEQNGQFSTEITCTGNNAYVAGWIDWNQNGVFDNPTERATARCGATENAVTTLTWSNINADYTLDGEHYYLRLRIADNVSALSPLGLTTSGEVEDWILPRLRPAMSLEKIAVANSSKVESGTEVTYTITLKNIGTAQFSAALPASVTDTLGEVLNQGELIPGTSGQFVTASKGTATLVGTTPHTTAIKWTSGNSTINVNESVTISYKVRVKDQPAGSSPIITNHAWVNNHIDSSVTWEKNKTGQDVPALCETATGRLLGESKQPICDTAQISRSNLLISKEIRKSVDGAAIPDGTILENGTYYYWIKFENRGGTTETIDHTDNYSDVMDDAPIYTEFGSQGLHKIIGERANEYRNWVDVQPRTTAVAQNNNTFRFTGTLKPQEVLYFAYRVDAWQRTGNSIMRNVLHKTGVDCTTAPNACVETEHPRQPSSTINVTKQLQNSAGAVIVQPAVSEIEGWGVRLGGDAAKAIEPTATYIDRRTMQDGSIAAFKISQNNKNGHKFSLAEVVDNIASRGYEHVGLTCSGTRADGTAIQPFAIAPTTTGTILPGDTLNCVLTNKQLPGTFSWNKVDAADSVTKLSGSAWEVTMPNGTTTVTVDDCVRTGTDSNPCGQSTKVHDSDNQAGQFTLSGLAWGTYTIREVSAPVGYVLPEAATTYTVTINGSSLNARLADIPNDKHAGLVVPLTGGLGSDAFKILGPVLLALAAVGAFIRWRRGHKANL